MTLKIGEIPIGKGAMLAPMAGITNPPFRRLCVELGAALTVTELISCHALSMIRKKPAHAHKRLGAATLPLMAPFDGEYPLVVQIFGRDPDLMVMAAEEAVDRGAHVVDLNFGCPAKKVVKNGEGAGCALMLVPDLLQEIARRVVGAVSVPVTAKMRIGWSPESKNGVEVAKRIEDAGVKLLTVHARTRNQVHSGPVDLEVLAGIVRAVTIPVIGNGGIRSAEDAKKMVEATGVRRVAVGQGAKGNPWIFRALAGNETEVTLTGRLDTCRRHLDLYVEWAGEFRAIREMRKHVAWYLKGFDGAAAVRDRINRTDDVEGVRRILDEVVDQIEAPSV